MWYNDIRKYKEKSIMNNEIKAETLCQGRTFGISITYLGERTVYSDVTRDREALDAFVDRINKGCVSPIHIEELIEDFIG